MRDLPSDRPAEPDFTRSAAFIRSTAEYRIALPIRDSTGAVVGSVEGLASENQHLAHDGLTRRIDDLMWHGQRLCRAMDRAREAEAEAAELRESLDHCLRMSAQSAVQIEELCRLLDEARENARVV